MSNRHRTPTDVNLVCRNQALRDRAQRRLDSVIMDKSGGDDACWPCEGSKMTRGYVTVQVPAGSGKGRHDPTARPFRSSAHRLSYALHVGAIEAGQQVCHRCDNPRCANPRHLFLGTPADNTRDMHRKGRGVVPSPMVGADHPRTKLTAQIVASAVARVRAGENRRTVATDIGLSKGGFDCIMSGHTWGHVTGISKDDPIEVEQRRRASREALAGAAKSRFTGKKQTPEQIRKRTESMLATLAKRKNQTA